MVAPLGKDTLRVWLCEFHIRNYIFSVKESAISYFYRSTCNTLVTKTSDKEEHHFAF